MKPHSRPTNYLALVPALAVWAAFAGLARAQSPVQTMPLYRYYDPQGGGHFWTTNPAEMAKACKRCRKEGPAAWLLTTGRTPGSVPFYRFYDAQTGSHFWTTDADWSQKACHRCRREGIAGWVLPQPTLSGTMAYNRYYHPSTGSHFWTTDPKWPEKACKKCKFEGPAGYVFGESRDILHQSFWRGGRGFSRRVPIIGERIMWNQATPWNQPEDRMLDRATLPSKDAVQSMAAYCFDGAVRQTIWQGNRGFSRTVPAQNGAVEWANAGPWQPGITIDKLPGTGTMQGHSDYVIGTTLHQAFWRGNQGWWRTVPSQNNRLNWQAARPWQGPIRIASLPGAGDMQSVDNLVVAGTLHQAFWRGGEGWWRTVPIDAKGTVQWNAAGAWEGPLAGTDIPGTGPVRGQFGFTVPYTVGLRQ